MLPGNRKPADELLIPVGTSTTPRFDGLARLVEEISRKFPTALVLVHDLNIVTAASLDERARAELSAKLADGSDPAFSSLLAAFRRAPGLVVRPNEPFGRLHLYNPPAERIAAASAGSLLFYPCGEDHCDDSWEVRFLSPGTSIAKFERFQDFGEAELLAYARRALLMPGGRARLSAAELAEDAPDVFWCGRSRTRCRQRSHAETPDMMRTCHDFI